MRKISILILYILICTHCTAQNWLPLKSGVNVQVRTLYSDTVDSVLYVGGNFITADGDTVNGLAKWDGTAWTALGSGPGWPVLAITRYNGELYAGGAILNGISKWDGNSWKSVGTGINGAVVGLNVYNGKLYVVGTFDTAGGILSNMVAIWDGSSWSNIGTGLENFVAATIFYKGELYAGGNFEIGGIREIAKWNGVNWEKVGNGFFGNSAVNTFEVYNNELYVGGYFIKANGNPGNYIAKWDGNTWSEVGGGMSGGNGQIYDFVIHNNELYAVGVFTGAGGVVADHIAKWDGNEWCGLGSILNNNIGTVEVYNNEIFIGGGFTLIDGDTLNYIAKWDGGSYVDNCGTISSLVEEPNIYLEDEVKIYPNPISFSSILYLSDRLLKEKKLTFTLYNLLGQEVKRMENINTSQTKFHRPGLESGIYIYKVMSDDSIITFGKVVFQ